MTVAERVGPARSRRQARERALALLYEAEVKDVTVDTVLAGLPVPPVAYAAEVLADFDAHLADIDAALARWSEHWDPERMTATDRAVLRLATFELAHRPDVPRNVVIDEAVDLARSYGTDDSPRFVNGVLARVADELRPEPA